MIKPKQHLLIHNFFAWYIKFIINKDFKAFFYNQIETDHNKAMLLIANHCSWWDGFLLFHLNKLYFKKNFHVMILEETAREVWFMKYLGAFSINKQAKNIVDSLKFAGDLLENADNLVLIFPQGKLYSSHVKDVLFERGLMHILRQSNQKIQCVFASILFDYFESRKPSVNIYLKKWELPEYTTLQIIKSEFNKHHADAKFQQSKKVI